MPSQYSLRHRGANTHLCLVQGALLEKRKRKLHSPYVHDRLGKDDVLARSAMFIRAIVNLPPPAPPRAHARCTSISFRQSAQEQPRTAPAPSPRAYPSFPDPLPPASSAAHNTAFPTTRSNPLGDPFPAASDHPTASRASPCQTWYTDVPAHTSASLAERNARCPIEGFSRVRN